MSRVVRWNLPLDGTEHSIGGGRVLHVDCHAGPAAMRAFMAGEEPVVVQVWTLEHDSGLRSDPPRMVRAFATEEILPIDQLGAHIGSVADPVNPMVWHLFEHGPEHGWMHGKDLDDTRMCPSAGGLATTFLSTVDCPDCLAEIRRRAVNKTASSS